MRRVTRQNVLQRRELISDAIADILEDRCGTYDDDELDFHAMFGDRPVLNATYEPGDLAIEGDRAKHCTLISHDTRLAIITANDGAFISCLDDEADLTWTLVISRWPPKLSYYTS